MRTSAPSSTADMISRIALWGPSGSGKTWLLNSFGKALLKCNLHDQEFTYALTEQSDEPYGPPVAARAVSKKSSTSEVTDVVWRFQRQPKRTTAAHLISAHTHILYIHDANGSELVNLTSQVRPVFVQADYVQVMLDPFLLSDLKPDQVSSNDNPQEEGDDINLSDLTEKHQKTSEPFGTTRQPITQSGYTDWVHHLLEFLAQSPFKKRYIGFCITKVDWLRQPQAPGEMLRTLFGQKMYRLVEQYKTRFPIEVFGISSAGYLEGAARRPNVDAQSGHLLAPEQWKPENVEAPFFWFFEQVERQRLAHTGSRLARFLFQNTRRNQYLPYTWNKQMK